MRLRAFIKSIITAPAILVPTPEPKPVDSFRFMEMSTRWGTPVLSVILPDGRWLTFVHSPRNFVGQPNNSEQYWDSYRGDRRDIEVVPWRGEGFPIYKAIENQLRWAYTNNPKSPALS